MNRIGVKTRIYIGFGIVLALIAGMAVMSFVMARQINDVFVEYRTTARQTLQLNLFIENLLSTRYAALDYRYDATGQKAREVQSGVKTLLEDKPDLRAMFEGNPEIQAEIDKLGAELAAYETAFAENRRLQTESKLAEIILSEAGPRAQNTLSQVMANAGDAQDLTTLQKAAEALNALNLARFEYEIYLRTERLQHFEEAMSQIEAAREVTATLENIQNDPDQRAAVTATLEDLAQFKTVAGELKNTFEARSANQTEQLNAISARIEEEYQLILTTVVDRQNTLGPEATATAAAKMHVVAVGGSLALLTGIILAGLIARGVTRPLTRLARNMVALSQNNLAIKVEGAEHQHELGQMAQSLVVFKENAIRIKALAEEKARDDAAVAKARQQMMAELRMAFGSVVDAAIAGDFSRRVTEDFPDEALNDLAKSVNRLLTTVNDGMDETGRVLARVADGDLTERMDGRFRGAFADLQENLNQTVGRLSETICEISEMTRDLGMNADEIAKGAVALAERTEQQASALEETTATTDEMSGAIKSNAETSSGARNLANGATERAAGGGQVVTDAVSAMSEIEGSANKISEIISVIDSIAFQTNLLALNAAVEAARAGDAGKGFAVVAQEVRALAQRSAEASNDIRRLIEISAGQVSNGVRLVTKTGEALTGIVESITQVEQSIEQIATNSSEQAGGIDQITTVISNMGQVTQQNSIMAEERARNAKNLAAGVQRLNRLIAYFQVANPGTAIPSVPAEPTAMRA
ncbi:MAG: methyl-accepting chemotaxis protein [Pseudomonadota bacterium]